MKARDEKYMREALRQAKRGLGRTSPNPMVGALIVRGDRIIARGYHRGPGQNHAEVDALSKLKQKVHKRDILYITLEPCNHFGRMPPCTEAILTSGIKRIAIGMKDPNLHVTGGGAGYLLNKGVEVKTGILEAECQRLNEAYVKHVTTGTPFIAVKSAQTLDGWTATVTGHSKWITNESSRRFVHLLRDRVDAVMVGIGTVLADDPLLTSRLPGKKTKDPVRVIVDTKLRISSQAKVIKHQSSVKTIIAIGSKIPQKRVKSIESAGVSIIKCPLKGGLIDLSALFQKLGAMSLNSVLVEGGSGITGSLIREKLVDKFYIFKAPKILGGGDGLPMATGKGAKRMDKCLNLRGLKVRRFEEDILIEGYPVYSSK